MEQVKLPQCVQCDGEGRPLTRQSDSPSLHSHRFLQDTALKLSADSQRHESLCATDRSQISTPPTVTPPKSRMSSSTQQREDERLMRSSFLAEAADCIRALQAVFDNAHVSTFSSRFEDWRKVDLKATAQLQQHVKSLQKLNESIGGFLARCSAVETFQEFHGTIDTLSQAIFELKDFREAFTNSIEEISDGITQRILTSLRAFDEERYSWLHKTLEAQGQSQESMIITQRKILNRLDSVGYSVDQQARASQAQKEQLARVDAVQSAIQQDCQCLVDLQQNVFKSFRNSSEQQESLQDNIFSKIGSGMENLESYMVNSLGWTSDLPSLSAAFNGLEARLTAWETKSLQDAMDLRLEVSKLESALRESEADLGRTRQEKDDGLVQQAALNESLHSLQDTLQQTSSQLATAELASMLNSMKRIREIEIRGNVKLDRQFGRIVLLQQLPFLPQAPAKDAKTPVTVTLADPSQAEAVLEDLLDIVSMFHVPLHISISCKLPKGGDTNAWQDMATKRAQILKDYLVDSGFPADKVQVSGAVGANEMQILLLDSSIFPPKPPAKNARGASKSPR
ncbi:magoh [Symbiodinium pilosum]|uniref:Magoh protein n=1 Tax=Symbiodinium pilosum TaxID=2952 RepID=A0A812YDX8_SYMPI|nr:magoh [Symbiodinium pilosum]